MSEHEWKDEFPDLEPGWYAIHYFWESHEGSYVSAALWTGTAWEPFHPVSQIAGPFSTEVEAEEWANAHEVIPE